jgi:RNA polymerase sigma-70 factor (ECF subfamily)
MASIATLRDAGDGRSVAGNAVLRSKTRTDEHCRPRGRTMDSQPLILGFLAGERTAVFQLTRWIALELRTLGNRFADRQREDLIQETLLRLWTVLGRGDYRGESGLQRYVRSIARHVVIDHLRKKPQREVTGDPPLATEVDRAARSDERLATQELVVRVLAGLPEEDGRLLIEAYVEERPYADMAAARGIAHGALKVRVFRAARRAREAWDRVRATMGHELAGPVSRAGS